MPGNPIPAALDQLAAHREQIERLNQREAGHHAAVGQRLTEIADLVTGIRGTLHDHHTVLAKLTDLDRQSKEAAISPDAAESGAGDAGYQPVPAPRWWKLTPAERPEPTARLRAWVEQVYRPGYGQLAAALGPC
jgi:hypothetical protein